MSNFITAPDDYLVDELESRGYDVRKKPRNYEIEPLHDLLCSRYNLSRFATKQKLVDLVEKELSI